MDIDAQFQAVERRPKCARTKVRKEKQRNRTMQAAKQNKRKPKNKEAEQPSSKTTNKRGAEKQTRKKKTEKQKSTTYRTTKKQKYSIILQMINLDTAVVHAPSTHHAGIVHRKIWRLIRSELRRMHESQMKSALYMWLCRKTVWILKAQVLLSGAKWLLLPQFLMPKGCS